MKNRPLTIRPVQTFLTFNILEGSFGKYDQGWSDGKPIMSDYSRLYLLTHGKGVVKTGNIASVLEPGNIYLFPANTEACYTCRQPMSLYWLHFRIEAIPGIDIFSSYIPPVQLTSEKNSLKLMQKLLNSLKEQKPDAIFTSINLLSQLLTNFLPKSWEDILPCNFEIKRLMPIIDFINNNYSQNIKLKTLAKQVHLHPTYLSNHFKFIFGITPIRYLCNFRLRHARALLLADTESINAIARRCGFRDPFYFTRLFKKRTGLAPREFRKYGGSLF